MRLKKKAGKELSSERTFPGIMYLISQRPERERSFFSALVFVLSRSLLFGLFLFFFIFIVFLVLEEVVIVVVIIIICIIAVSSYFFGAFLLDGSCECNCDINNE